MYLRINFREKEPKNDNSDYLSVPNLDDWEVIEEGDCTLKEFIESIKMFKKGKTRYDLATPGQYLKHEFLVPLNITQTQLANDIDVPISRISEIINGTRSITADTAIRLSVYFKTTAQMWMNLQSHYDLEIAERHKLALIKNRIRPLS